jgi:hypothetical protein
MGDPPVLLVGPRRSPAWSERVLEKAESLLGVAFRAESSAPALPGASVLLRLFVDDVPSPAAFPDVPPQRTRLPASAMEGRRAGNATRTDTVQCLWANPYVRHGSRPSMRPSSELDYRTERSASQRSPVNAAEAQAELAGGREWERRALEAGAAHDRRTAETQAPTRDEDEPRLQRRKPPRGSRKRTRARASHHASHAETAAPKTRRTTR